MTELDFVALGLLAEPRNAIEVLVLALLATIQQEVSNFVLLIVPMPTPPENFETFSLERDPVNCRPSTLRSAANKAGSLYFTRAAYMGISREHSIYASLFSTRRRRYIIMDKLRRTLVAVSLGCCFVAILISGSAAAATSNTGKSVNILLGQSGDGCRTVGLPRNGLFELCCASKSLCEKFLVRNI